jgi:hypothetical protein
MMMGRNQEQSQFRASENDRMLDAALAKYTAVEPRAGLEDRVLTRVRAEQARSADRAWWRGHWGWAGATAVVIVSVMLAVTWNGKSGPPSPPIASHPATMMPSQQRAATKTPETTNSATQAASRDLNSVLPRHNESEQRPIKHSSQPEFVADTAPKLDKFPSPRPLSEQEKMLLEYVQQNPEEAAMIAQAQTALARQQELERYAPQQGDTNLPLREQLE